MATRKEVTFVPSINWEIESKQIAIMGAEDPIKGYQALVRNDTNNVVSVFKKSYNFLPNSEFTSTAERISKITGYPIEGFQEINGGKRVLAYLKNQDKNFKLVGEDLEDYLVLGNSHDGSTSLFLGNSSTIIRCMNQFGTIVQNMKVRHSSNMDQKLEDIIVDIQSYFEGVKRMNRTFERFREVKIDKELIEAIAMRIFEVENLTDISERKLEKMNAFKDSAEEEIDALGSNMWGLFNGVTHFTTHKMANRNPTLGNFWGQAGDMNRRALNFGNELLESRSKVLVTV